MAKSSPLAVLRRVQESLCRGNCTPVEFYYYGTTHARPTPSSWGFLFLRHSQLIHMINFLNLRTQPSQYTVYIIGHSPHSTLFYTGHSLHGTLFSIGPSLHSTLSTQDAAFAVHCLHRTQPSQYTVSIRHSLHGTLFSIGHSLHSTLSTS